MAKISMLATIAGMLFAALASGCSHQTDPTPATNTFSAAPAQDGLANPQGRQAKQDFIARMKQAQMRRNQATQQKP
ncbi:MAG: hypothetical protein ACRYFS_01505 [Janthinobacterium lividum]